MEGERGYVPEHHDIASERRDTTPDLSSDVEEDPKETPTESLAEQVREVIRNEKAAKRLEAGQEIFTQLENRYLDEARAKYMDLGFDEAEIDNVLGTLEKPYGYDEVSKMYKQRGGTDFYGLRDAFTLYLTAGGYRSSKNYHERVISGHVDEFKRVGAPEAQATHPVEYIQNQCSETVSDFATSIYLEGQFQLAMDTKLGRLARKAGSSAADIAKTAGEKIGDVRGEISHEISDAVRKIRWKMKGY